MKKKISRAYPLLKPRILFYINGLATWYGFPDITHFKVKIAACRPLKIYKFYLIFEHISLAETVPFVQ